MMKVDPGHTIFVPGSGMNWSPDWSLLVAPPAAVLSALSVLSVLPVLPVLPSLDVEEEVGDAIIM